MNDVLFLILIALAVWVFMKVYNREYMTNADLISAMSKYGTKKPATDPTKKTSSDTPSEAQIYGPQASGPGPSSSTYGPGKNPNKPVGNYPDIFGPDTTAEPGMPYRKCSTGKVESDTATKCGGDCDDSYDYNPDFQKAFPTSGPPQPFLNDFRPFQR